MAIACAVPIWLCSHRRLPSAAAQKLGSTRFTRGVMVAKYGARRQIAGEQPATTGLGVQLMPVRQNRRPVRHKMITKEKSSFYIHSGAGTPSIVGGSRHCACCTGAVLWLLASTVELASFLDRPAAICRRRWGEYGGR
ncbi:hypothetical protein ACS8YF_01040 [Salinisphaera sp. SWV1]